MLSLATIIVAPTIYMYIDEAYEYLFQFIFCAVISAVALFMLITLYFGTYYKIEKDKLTVHAFFLNLQLDYKYIKKVRIKKGIFFGTALSVKRVEISYGFNVNKRLKKIDISPADTETFLAELKKYAPNAEYILPPVKNTKTSKKDKANYNEK